MRLRVGTSGFGYKEWKGPFYPEKLPAKDMLAYYAERLPTVEINNTFYRMPKRDVLAGWAERVPPDFRFVLKASRRITHQAKLRDAGDPVGYLFDVAGALGERLGAVLFQLPPYLKKDVELLRDFLASLPDGARVAVEFRSSSWLDDSVYEVLRDADAALCAADFDDDAKDVPLVPTASWGYVRLRAAGYADAALADWVDRLSAQPWDEAFVFFKHEDEGVAPALAARMLEIAESDARRGPRRVAGAGREAARARPMQRAERARSDD